MYQQIKKATMALFLSLFCFVAYAQQTVTGTVKDATGEPMIGVTILLDGQTAAITDLDGNFTVDKVKPSSVLKVSYIGYLDKSVTIGNKTTLNIVMEEDNKVLDEVVVVGYGQMKKSDLTGAISSVDTDKLNAKGATTIAENLQGSVPGVNITQNSSRAGGGFDIEIRGTSTFGSNQTPLYVVDGIICDDINFLNPQDIERIDILKDASSTAIYGSRATNGVVIVTTKSAKEQGKKNSTKPVISYDGYYGITKAVRMPDFMDGSQFAQYRMFRYENAMQVDENGHPSSQLGTYGAQNYWGMTDGNYSTAFLTRGAMNDSYVKETIANGNETNWRDLFLRTGAQQNHFLSVSGNGGNVNYHFGAGYQNENGVFEGDAMERFNLKAAVDSRITDFLSAGLSFNGAYTNHRTVDNSAISSAFRLNPLCRAYDDEGNIIPNPGMSSALGTAGDQFTSTANPLLDLTNSMYGTKTYKFLANLYLELRPIKDVRFKTTFSPDYTAIRGAQYEGSETAARNNGDSRAYTNNYHKMQWTWDNQIDYNHSWGDHNLSAMGLFSASKFNQEKYESEVYDINEAIRWWNMGQAGSSTYTIGSGYTEWSMLSWAARVNYNYKGRYYFTGTMRWDGSSRFVDGHRWGSFPSAAVAWRISEEPFMKKVSTWLSNLKLRATFGTTGNNYTQGSNYAYAVTASGGSVYYGFADGSGLYPYYPSGIVNRLISWEKTTEYNIGLDFGFLKNRITGTLDWYTKNSKDLLADRQLPYEAGGATVTDNVGKVRNTGFEFSITTVNVQTKDWNWTTSLNFSHNKNKVIDTYGNKETDIQNSRFIGESLYALYNYSWTGIVNDKPMTVPNHQIAIDKGFTPGETVISRDYYFTCYGWGEGMPIVADLNGDGAIDANDKKIVGKMDPSWTGSFNSTLSYKNWDFSFSLYTKQNYEVYSPFYKQYTNYGDRGMEHINMDFYIPDGALLSCDYDENGNRINEVYQQGTHYGSYPFPTNQSQTAAGVGTYAFSNNGKDGADNMSSMKTANQKGAPYQIVDASYWKVKNISLGYTFPKSILGNGIVKSLRLYVNITNPFVFGTDYKGFDPEWAGASLSSGGPSTTTYQIGASIKF